MSATRTRRHQLPSAERQRVTARRVGGQLIMKSAMRKTKASVKSKSVVRRIFLKHVTSPWTLFPLMIGLPLFVAGEFLGWGVSPVMLASVGLILLGFGTFFARLIFGSGRVERAALADFQRENHTARKVELDRLTRRLNSDGDARAADLLGDLRTLSADFNQQSESGAAMDASVFFDIYAHAERLFDTSVDSLEASHHLNATACRVNTAEAREPMLDEHARILDDVQGSIGHLGRVLAELQGLGRSEKGEDDALAEIRDELDRSVDIAKRVEARLREMRFDLDEHEPQSL